MPVGGPRRREPRQPPERSRRADPRRRSGTPAAGRRDFRRISRLQPGLPGLVRRRARERQPVVESVRSGEMDQPRLEVVPEARTGGRRVHWYIAREGVGGVWDLAPSLELRAVLGAARDPEGGLQAASTTTARSGICTASLQDRDSRSGEGCSDCPLRRTGGYRGVAASTKSRQSGLPQGEVGRSGQFAAAFLPLP